DRQASLVEAGHGFDQVVFDEVRVEAPQVRRDAQIARRDQGSRLRLFDRIDIKLQIILEQPAKAFQNAPFEVRVVLLVEYLAQTRHAHRDTNHLFRVEEEVGGQPVILRIIRYQDGFAEGAEDVHAIEKVLVVDL